MVAALIRENTNCVVFVRRVRPTCDKVARLCFQMRWPSPGIRSPHSMISGPRFLTSISPYPFRASLSRIVSPVGRSFAHGERAERVFAAAWW